MWFAAGIAIPIVVVLRFDELVNSGSSRTRDDQSGGQPKSDQQLKFHRVKGASGRTVDGAEFTSQVYTSSDGVTLSVRVDTFKTSSRARLQLMKLVRGAKIIDRKPRVDRTGKELGEQLIARFLSRRSRDVSFGVFWTEQARLYSIRASSLRHVQEFEKGFTP